MRVGHVGCARSIQRLMNLVNLFTQLPDDVLPAAQLPQQVRQGRRRRVGAGDALKTNVRDARTYTTSVTDAHMRGAFCQDILLGHRASRRVFVLQKALYERNRHFITIAANAWIRKILGVLIG